MLHEKLKVSMVPIELLYCCKEREKQYIAVIAKRYQQERLGRPENLHKEDIVQYLSILQDAL